VQATCLTSLLSPKLSLGSIGNGIEGRESAAQMIIGIGSFLLFLLVPFCVRIDIEDFVSTDNTLTFRIISLVCGLLVTILQLFHLLMIYIRRHPTHHNWYDWYYSQGNIKYESKIKKAGMFKVDQMLASALTLHRGSLKLACNCNGPKCKRIGSRTQTNYGRALFEYSKLDGVMTTIGGICFTWGRIWDGTLFSEEGKTPHTLKRSFGKITQHNFSCFVQRHLDLQQISPWHSVSNHLLLCHSFCSYLGYNSGFKEN
jgi:hypothetical protein